MGSEARILKSSNYTTGLDTVPSELVTKIMELLESTIGYEVVTENGHFYAKDKSIDPSSLPEELIERLGLEGLDSVLRTSVTMDLTEPLHRNYTGLKSAPTYILIDGEPGRFKAKMVEFKVRTATADELADYRADPEKYQFKPYSITFDMPYVIKAGTEIEYYDDVYYEDHIYNVKVDTKVPLHYQVYTHLYLDNEAEEIVVGETIVHTHSVMGYLI